MGELFYFQLIRKYVVLFGTLFNDISITRTTTWDKSTNPDTTQLLKVPVTYSPKDKMLARVTEDSNIDRPTAVNTLPIISFEMGNIEYDPSRKFNTQNKIVSKNEAGFSNYQYAPVPYNFHFKLYIYVKNAEDGTKIVEQILPFFTPVFTITAELIPEMGVKTDIPIVLNKITHTDTYDGSFKNRRAIIWQLDFTLKGVIYGPVKTSSVIKFTNTNFYFPSGNNLCEAIGTTPIVGKTTIQPGLTANGQPTTDISNSIPYQEINADDTFGYIVTEYGPEDLIQ